MNTKLLMLAAAATLGLAAQGAGRSFSAKIPFAFEANGQKMSAGEYRILPSESVAYIAIRHADTGRSIFVVNSGGNGNRLAGTQMVFNVYGDRYFLNSITDSATGTVIRIPKSRTEKEIARIVPVETAVRNAE